MEELYDKLQCWKSALIWGPLIGGIIGGGVYAFILFRINDFESKIRKYSETNQALRTETLQVVSSLRKFIAQSQEKESEEAALAVLDKPRKNSREALKQDLKKQLEYERNRSNRTEEYNKEFKVKAIELKDKLRARMPKDYKPVDIRPNDLVYRQPVNYFDYNDIADDLEKMALALK